MCPVGRAGQRPGPTSGTPHADAVTDEVRAEEVIAQATAAPVSPSELPALSGYAEMSIAELRSKLDFLELDDLQTLLAWEMAHGELHPS